MVAFSGHRTPVTATDRLSDALEAVFRDIGRAVDAGGDAACRPAVHLLTGAAPGADRAAVAAARRAGVDRVHALLPYGDDAVGLTDRPQYAGPAERVALPGSFDAVEVLDGLAADRSGDDGHRALARVLVERADLVVVLWDGAPARGPGGTGDVVALAQAAGVPVLWLPDTAAPGALVGGMARPGLAGDVVTVGTPAAAILLDRACAAHAAAGRRRALACNPTRPNASASVCSADGGGKPDR